MKKYLLSILMIFSALAANAFTIEATRMHCSEDTAKINKWLQEAIAADLKTPNQYMSFFADKLLGTPYVAGTLEGDREYLTINVDELDCTTFVETLIALTKAAMANSPTWYTYAAKLENVRYRNGELEDYASRLHYISAWVVDNTARGNFQELTSAIPTARPLVKSINFMSQHRDKYAALADSTQFQKIRNLEMGYNLHQFYYIDKKSLKKKNVVAELINGDIVCLVTKVDGLDVSHLGIVRFVDGEPHLLHASSTAQKVIIDEYNLFDMLKNQRNIQGVRIIRVSESRY